VLQVSGGGPPLYLKIVRPSVLDALRERHDLLAGPVPVPRLLATTPDGMAVLAECPGTPLRSLLARDAPLPPPATLGALLDAIPDDLLRIRGRSTHLQRVGHFAGVLSNTAVTAPADRDRLEALATRLDGTDPGTHPDVGVHGDFYEGQLLATGGRVTGLLDVDTAGRGHRIDEWATLVAHLSVLALHGSPAARRYGAQLLTHAEELFARDQLRPRIAAAVLGLATGPFRVQQDRWRDHTLTRLGLAARWSAG
jgi:hypothetical protein